MKLNPIQWYVDRELSFVPTHFTKANTILTDESLFWVRTKLIGRYAIMHSNEDNVFSILANEKNFYFEDPAEAMIYELRWSGKK